MSENRFCSNMFKLVQAKSQNFNQLAVSCRQLLVQSLVQSLVLDSGVGRCSCGWRASYCAFVHLPVEQPKKDQKS